MAPLEIRTSTTEFSSLESKYSNFYTPAFQILVGDGKTKILDQGVAVDSVTVDTSIYKADICSFTVVNAYDVDDSKFLWIDEYFVLGSPIEVKMGYLDTFETVFEGIITSVSFNFPDTEVPQIIVEGSDKSFLMMKGTKSETWLKKKYSEVASAIGSKYSLTCKVQDSSIKHEVVRKVNTSDYQFLSAMAKELNYEFFVTGTTLYFRPPRTVTAPITTLSWGKNLRGFSPTFSLTDLIPSVKVRGYQGVEKKVIEGSATSAQSPGADFSKSSGSLKKIVASETVEFLYRNSVSEDEAKKLAQAELDRRANHYIAGSGQSFGIPEIQAGRFIKIEGIGGQFNGNYYISTATHKINSQEYTTYIEMSGEGMDMFSSLSNDSRKIEENVHGVQVGVVSNIKDPENLGRVKVKLPIKENDDETDWITVTTLMGGKEMGTYFLPEVGDQVLVIHDNAPVPNSYVIGALWNKTEKPPLGNDEGKNNIRKIKTRSGNELIFNDESGKEAVTLKTKAGHTVNMEDQSKKIEIKDSSGNNSVTIDGNGNEMTIKANMKINIQAQSCKIAIDSAQNSVTIESPMQLKIKSQMIDIEAGANLNIKSDGMLNIKGTMVKIN